MSAMYMSSKCLPSGPGADSDEPPPQPIATTTAPIATKLESAPIGGPEPTTVADGELPSHEMTALLAVDVGNTNTVLGIFRDGELAAHWRISTVAERTSDEYAVLMKTLLDIAGFP